MAPIALDKEFYQDDLDVDFSITGKALREPFGDTDLRIVLHLAGAIPYYSNYNIINMLEQNDAWIAEHGYTDHHLNFRPDHYRISPYQYLKDQKTDIIIGNPY